LSERPTPWIRTSAGVAILGRQVIVHGRDLHHECLDLSFVHYLLFCVCGRRLEERQARVLEELWVSTGYPDPRIWCNRIAAYLGSARVDPGLAMSAALAASDSVAYGFRAVVRAFEVQASIPEAMGERTCWLERELAAKRILHGYGRPIHGRDERIAVGLRSLAEAGLPAGPGLKRAFWLHDRLKEAKGIEMNVAALWAAIAIDFGLRRREYEQFMTLMFAPGYAAAYADQRARPPLTFLAGHQSGMGGAEAT
jgi:citrate synthase